MIVMLMALVGVGLAAGLVAAHPHRKSLAGFRITAAAVFLLPTTSRRREPVAPGPSAHEIV